jgi:para-nitrobenzyl esterase
LTTLQVKKLKELIVMEPVKTEAGYVSGAIIGEPGQEVRIYRGIPYAAPPVGELRWMPPQPVTPWSGTLPCTEFKPIVPQANLGDLPPFPQILPSSEDCLYLNVLTPAKKASDKLPVMVWMHGGGYQLGSGSDPLTNAPRLPQHGIVLVNVNMRLNTLGMLAHPLLSKESAKGVSGNYLFLDMLAALQWVQKNIAAFGGDPQNVTIFGESGGGVKVANLMASPLAKGLFHRAICESGTSVRAFSTSKPLKELGAMGEKFFAKLGVDKELDPLAAARALPWEKIIATDNTLIKELSMFGPEGLWDAAVDGWFLPDTPSNIFKAGRQNNVPLIVCANLGEVTGPGVLVFPFLIPGYVDMLSSVSQAGQKGYAAIFDHVPASWKREGCISTHAMELGYVFGDWDDKAGNWPMLYFLAGESGAKSPDPGLTDTDRKVSEAMMAMWTQFARTGNPNVKGLVEWPAYDASEPYLYIAEPLAVKSGFSKVG